MRLRGRPRSIPRGHPAHCLCLGCSRIAWKLAMRKAFEMPLLLHRKKPNMQQWRESKELQKIKYWLEKDRNG